MTPEDLAIVHAMQGYGGSFVRHLADAATYADDHNLARLKAAFPELWERYQKMAALDSPELATGYAHCPQHGRILCERCADDHHAASRRDPAAEGPV